MQINITASPETTARSKVSPSETYLQTCLLPSGAARPSFELGRGVSFDSEGVLPLSARFLSGVSPRCMKFHGISWNFTLNQALNTSATATYTFRHEKASHPNFFQAGNSGASGFCCRGRAFGSAIHLRNRTSFSR